MKIVRYIIGLLIIIVIFWAATGATRDCRVSPYLGENCLSLWASHTLGVPFTPLLRSAVLEIVGLMLVVGLYLALRFLSAKHSSTAPSLPDPPEPPRGGQGSDT